MLNFWDDSSQKWVQDKWPGDFDCKTRRVTKSTPCSTFEERFMFHFHYIGSTKLEFSPGSHAISAPPTTGFHGNVHPGQSTASPQGLRSGTVHHGEDSWKGRGAWRVNTGVITQLLSLTVGSYTSRTRWLLYALWDKNHHSGGVGYLTPVTIISHNLEVKL